MGRPLAHVLLLLLQSTRLTSTHRLIRSYYAAFEQTHRACANAAFPAHPVPSMSSRMAFEDWVSAWFDRPDHWDWVCAEDLPELPAAETLAYATQLFQSAGALLAPYSDTQVGTGLWAFINEIGSPLYALRDKQVPLAVRHACLAAGSQVFEEVFATRCTEALGHLSEPSGELNAACYMWWDIFPLYTGASPELDDTALTLMERTLALSHAACQESALHGLGHWHHGDHAKRIERTIDTFLARKAARRPELVVYAQNARRGYVL